jgi:prepilin-type N-terminal cleavage/methylation domain-containing protein
MSMKHSVRGFSLIEVVIVLAILAAIIGLLAPAAYQAISSARGTGSQVALESIHQGILGDQVTTFGYYGDVGDFPASLMDLARDPTGSTPGWKGPYLNVPAGSVSSSTLLDSYGSPFEYYLLDNITNLPHRLAVISRGPDGSSTNASVTPNTWTSFAGTLPTANGYMADTGNADNLVYPLVDSTSNNLLLQRRTLGTYAPTITNFDSNGAVNAAVPACPGLFTMTLTSVPRGSSDVRTEKLGPVSSFDLQQGAWQVSVTSPLATGPVFSQNINVLPSQAFSPMVALSGINSGAGATTFTLSLFNNVGVGLDVYISNVKSATVAANNATTVYTVAGCAPIRLQRTTTSTVADSFTMPYVSYLRNVATAALTLTVINGSLTGATPPQVSAKTPEVKVYQYVTATTNVVQIGQVAKGTQESFTVATRDNIVIKNSAGTDLKTIAAIAVNTTVTCTSSGCT